MVPAVSRQRFRPVPSLLRSYPLKGCAPAPPGIGSFPRLFTLSFIPLLRNKFRHAKINRLFVRVEYLSQILDVQRVRDPNCRSDCGFTRAVFILCILEVYPMDSLNAQFKKIRLERGFTQKQVADGLNIPEQGYQRYEYGKVVPSALVLIALADFYDVSLDYLVGRSDDPARH